MPIYIATHFHFIHGNTDQNRWQNFPQLQAHTREENQVLVSSPRIYPGCRNAQNSKKLCYTANIWKNKKWLQAHE